jgi:hypothetical protein
MSVIPPTPLLLRCLGMCDSPEALPLSAFLPMLLAVLALHFLHVFGILGAIEAV